MKKTSRIKLFSIGASVYLTVLIAGRYVKNTVFDPGFFRSVNSSLSSFLVSVKLGEC